jgi:hypothetical protein
MANAFLECVSEDPVFLDTLMAKAAQAIPSNLRRCYKIQSHLRNQLMPYLQQSQPTNAAFETVAADQCQLRNRPAQPLRPTKANLRYQMVQAFVR